jgi:hypothetical protein
MHLWENRLMGCGTAGSGTMKPAFLKRRPLFGELAGEVARQHIISDLKEEGWTENDPFPQDERHYVAMGLF